MIQAHIPREIIAGFEPFNFLVESRPLRPVKANKPRKPKTEHQDGQRSADNARGHKPKSKNPRNKADSSGNRNPNPGGRRKNPASHPLCSRFDQGPTIDFDIDNLREIHRQPLVLFSMFITHVHNTRSLCSQCSMF